MTQFQDFFIFPLITQNQPDITLSSGEFHNIIEEIQDNHPETYTGITFHGRICIVFGCFSMEDIPKNRYNDSILEQSVFVDI